MLKNLTFIFSFASIFVIPLTAGATTTAGYLEVTYSQTIQVPIVAMDGMNSNPISGSWSTTRALSAGTLRGDTYVQAGSGSPNSSTHAMLRAFFSADTSSIPDDAVIEDASLNLYVKDVTDMINTSYSYITVLQGSPASSTNIVGDDYNDCGSLDNPTLGSNAYDISSITLDAYQAFLLNTAGKSWVNKTGYTTLCMRDGHDIENQSYSGSGSWIQQNVGFSRN